MTDDYNFSLIFCFAYADFCSTVASPRAAATECEKEFYQCHRSVSTIFHRRGDETMHEMELLRCSAEPSDSSEEHNSRLDSSASPHFARARATRRTGTDSQPFVFLVSDVCCWRSPPVNPFRLFAFEPPSVAHFFTHSHRSVRDYSTRSTKSTAKCQRHEFSSPNTINKNAKSDKHTRTRANAAGFLFRFRLFALSVPRPFAPTVFRFFLIFRLLPNSI